jgi:flagellar protein FliJ
MSMKSRDAALRLKRFDVAEKARKASDLESMIRDFETITVDLDRQISAEEERTGVKDVNHFAYSTFAKSAHQRRDNLNTSVADLRLKLDAARLEHDAVSAELLALEAAEPARDNDRNRMKVDRNGALLN